jgi:hypothetical protein
MMSWSPQRWALVWATRLELFADNEECRSAFDRSLTASAEALRAAMPAELFVDVERAAGTATPAEMRALSPRLRDWARGAKADGTSEETEPAAAPVRGGQSPR